jgi:aspartyl protease family protein
MDETGGAQQLVYLLLLLAAVGTGVFYRMRTDARTVIAQLGIWIALIAGITLLYSYRADFSAIGSRLKGELVPRDGVITGDHQVSFQLTRNGHYEVTASLDGTPTVFTIDTGASGIVLTPQTAERLGYDVSKLSFNMLSETANGYGRSAPIRISELIVGPIVMHDVPVRVNMTDMSHSLLGMEFLSRLKSLHVEGDRITLEQ